MKKLLYTAGCALAILAVSCVKETNNDIPQGGFSIEANMPEDVTSKTTLDGLSVKWTDTDKINVNGSESQSIELVGEGTSAVFNFPDDIINAPYKAVYPASVYTSESTITLPAVQNYVENGFDPAAAVMAGYQESTGAVDFRHMMAYLKINIAAGTKCTDNIKSIAVKGGGNENMSGVFNISYASSSSISCDSNDGNAVTLDCGEQGISQNSTIVIAIPAGTYSGLQITFTDVAGHYLTLDSPGEFNAEKGYIYPTAVTYEPEGTTIDGEIWNVDDWARFAAAVKSGSYEGWMNTKLMSDVTFENFDNDVHYVKEAEFNGVFDGNGHTITATRTIPLFSTIGVNGEVKNLITDGEFSKTTIASQKYAAFASIAKVNYGKISNCINKASCIMDAEISSENGIGFGFIVNQNAGELNNCKNEGDLTLKVALTNSTTSSRRLYGGGIAALGHSIVENRNSVADETAGAVAGKFIDCVNEGDINVIVGSSSSGNTECKSGIGGICGAVFMSGVQFDGCINRGNISRTRSEDVTNDSNAMNKSYNVGGILGRCAGTYDSGNNIDALPGSLTTGYFDVSIVDCDNYGTINLTAENYKQGDFALTYNGNRLTTVGGIVGVVLGADSQKCKIELCENHGMVSAGWSGKSELTVLGGIAGFAKNVTIDQCTVAEDATLKTNENGGVGALGAIAGFTAGTVGISSCTASPVVDFIKTKEVSSNGNTYLSYWGVAAGVVSTATTTVSDCTFSPEVTIRTYDATSEAYVPDASISLGASNWNTYAANIGGESFLVLSGNTWTE